MKAVFISDNGRYHKKFTIRLWADVFLPLSLVVLLSYLATILFSTVDDQGVSHDQKVFRNHELSRNQEVATKKINYLLKKLSSLEAQTKRLNTLGYHVSKQIKLDIEAFSLEKEPARGGLYDSFSQDRLSHTTPETIYTSLVDSENSLLDLEQLFTVYQTISSIRKGKEKDIAFESSYTSPVLKGYISSSFGKRRDPINGRHRLHGGIDIAGVKGTAISPILKGIVTFVGKRGAYGSLIEIQHDSLLKSRYAHLDSIFVKKGDVVKKGFNIGTMGATGRVTGPHLHLEIWRGAEKVNPRIYLDKALNELEGR